MDICLNQLPFLDRRDDCRVIKTKFQDNNSIVLLNSKPSSGVTRFCENLKHELKEEFNNLFYIKLHSNGQNSVYQFYSQIIPTLKVDHPELFKSFNSYLARNNLTKEFQRVTAPLARIIPVFGSLISEIIKPSWKYCSDFQDSGHVLNNIITPWLVSNENRILLIIDNIEHSSEDLINLLNITNSSHNNISYVFAHSSKCAKTYDINSFINKMAHGMKEFYYIPFHHPGEDFVVELANHINESEIAKIAMNFACRTKDIYQIFNEIKAYFKGNYFSSIKFTPLERFITLVLYFINSFVKLSDIQEMAINSKEIYLCDTSEIDNAVFNLKNYHIVKSINVNNNQEMISLQINDITKYISNEEIKTLTYSYTNMIYHYYYNLYEACSFMHLKVEIAPLLYKLSKKIYPAKKIFWAKENIKISLLFGDYSSLENYLNIFDNEDNDSDSLNTIYHIISLCVLKKYKTAYNIMTKRKMFGESVPASITILYGFIVNRCRMHKKSIEILTPLLLRHISEEEEYVALSIIIVSYVHSNEVKKAQEVYRNYDDKPDSKYKGYYIRNAAYAFDSINKIEMLEKAINVFKNSDDNFGYSSSRLNYSTLKCLKEANSDNIKLLKESYNELTSYGVCNINIAENNLGLCLALSEIELDNAEKHLRKAFFYSNTKMPKYFSMLNLVYCLSIQGKNEDATQFLSELPDLENNSFTRIHQRYYINYLLLSYYNKVDFINYEYYLQQAKNYLDRKNPKRSKKIVNQLCFIIDSKSEMTRENLKSLFWPCSLAYWYYNPMTLIDLELLSG